MSTSRDPAPKSPAPTAPAERAARPPVLTVARVVSFLVLVGILIVIATIFFRVMAAFLVPLFLAALLGVVVQPLHRWTLEKCRGYRHAAAGITTSLVLLIVLLPIGLVITTATLEGLSLIDQLQLADVRAKLDSLKANLNLDMPLRDHLHRMDAMLKQWRNEQIRGDIPDVETIAVENMLARTENMEAWIKGQGPDAPAADIVPLREALVALRDAAPGSVDQDDALALAAAEFKEFKANLLGGTYRAWLVEAVNPTDEQMEQIRRNLLSAAGPALSFGGDTLALAGKLLFGILIMIAALFFFLAEGQKMVEALIRISPLEEQHVRELVAEFVRACRAIVSATLLSAVVQGLLAGIGFYFAGLRGSVFMLMLLTTVLSLVPFTGAAAVWIPTSLYLYFYEGNLFAAIGLALYGACIISTSDNFIKPLVLSGQSNLHPLLALLSVLGGLQALGPIGIVVGPMAVVFLQTLLRLLQRELSSIDKSSWTFWRGIGNPGTIAPATAPPSAAESPAGEIPPEVPATDFAAPPSPPTSQPPASGNGSAAAGGPRPNQPARHGKKRRK
jgi:predicted PurR-regulated permease PerM